MLKLRKLTLTGITEEFKKCVVSCSEANVDSLYILDDKDLFGVKDTMDMDN